MYLLEDSNWIVALCFYYIPQKNGGLHGMGEMCRKYQSEHPNQRSGRSWERYKSRPPERRARPPGHPGQRSGRSWDRYKSQLPGRRACPPGHPGQRSGRSWDRYKSQLPERRACPPGHPGQRSGRSWERYKSRPPERRACPSGLPDKTAVTQGVMSQAAAVIGLLIIQRRVRGCVQLR